MGLQLVLLMESYILIIQQSYNIRHVFYSIKYSRIHSAQSLSMSEKTSFLAYPLGDSVGLKIVLPSAHNLETPGTRKEGGGGSEM